MNGAGTETQLRFFPLGLPGKGVPINHQQNLKVPVLHRNITYVLSCPEKGNLHNKFSIYSHCRESLTNSSL